MSISEFLKLRNAIFILAEEQAHVLTCVSGRYLFFRKCGFNRIKSMLMAFRNEKGK